MSENKKYSGNRIGNGGIGGFMFLAFIGAAIYFVSKADGFWDSILGVLKALVWPAFVIFKVLENLNI